MSTTTIPSTTAAWPAGLTSTDLPVIAEHLAARAADIRQVAIAEAVDATRDQLGSDPRTRALHAARGLAQAADLDRLAALLTAPVKTSGAAA